MLENIKKLIDAGYFVIPCVDKKAIVRWKDISSPDVDNEEAAELCLKALAENMGYSQLGNVLRNDTFVLDFDSQSDYEAFIGRFGEQNTMITKTPNGYHVYYRLSVQPKAGVKKELFEGCKCDFRAAYASYVICAGNGINKATGLMQNYEISNLMPQSELPYMGPEIESLLVVAPILENNEIKNNESQQLLTKREAFKRLLKCENELLNAEPGTRNDALNKFAFQAGIMSEFIEHDEAYKKMTNIFDAWNVQIKNKDKMVFEAGYKSGQEHKAESVDNTNLTKNENGKLARSYANLNRIIATFGKIEQNSWTKRIDFTSGKYKNENMQNKLFTKIQTEISKIYGLDYSIYDIDSHICAMAEEYNPVARWLDSLKWDGKRRLDGWLAKTIGCENDEVATEAENVLFYGAINRAINPGCKLDEMVVFVGDQGVGKSQLLKSLYGAEYLMTAPINMGMDRIRQVAPNLAQKWVCEVGELNSLVKAKDYSEVKDYLSQQIDTYVPVYERQSVNQPRHCIFVGTTNERDFLNDPTGNRRFLIVDFNNKLNIDDQKEIIKEREQLWAEAYVNFCAGKRYIPNYKLIQNNATKYEVTSSVDEKILEIAKTLEATKNKFKTSDILDLMGVPVDKMKLFDKQISFVLQKNGFIKKKSDGQRYYIGTENSNVILLRDKKEDK